MLNTVIEYSRAALAACVLTAAAGAASAEGWYTIQIPLGVQDKEKFDLCTKIGDLGGIDGSINCGRASLRNGTGIEALTYFTAQGPESMVRELFADGSPVAAEWGVDVETFLSGGRGSAYLTPKVCTGILLPEACGCTGGGAGSADIQCVVKMGGEIPWPVRQWAEIKRMDGVFSAAVGAARSEMGQSLFIQFDEE